ncbi:MAG: hypothetical protein JJE52_00025 [Acidimicrobiia bacterium]|nr:hypothetical protein [Acidimicrobiia bacterium]
MSDHDQTGTFDGMDVDDDDLIDGCDCDMCDDPVDDEVVSLLPLFPDQDPSTAHQWRELFGAAP